MALFGWLLGPIFGAGELLTAIVSGALLGRWGCGRSSSPSGSWWAPVIGALFAALDGGAAPALVAAAVAVVYRVIAAIVYRAGRWSG